jgi:hypothetical protein
MTSYRRHYKKTDSTWIQMEGSTHDYVITWETNAELYNAQLRDPNARLNDAQKLNMLQHAVSVSLSYSWSRHPSTCTFPKEITPIEAPPILCALTFCVPHTTKRTDSRTGLLRSTTLRHLDTSNKREVNATEGNTKYEAFVSKFYKQARPA